ncbi:MAG: cell division topological specificity factor MinE [Alphaproteobacteria bacterium]|nr:cell division topological specificity factor MinE [Alphaproteobacteria bacterium]MBM3625268.1 cell division topological specificity factor MinE [Alphaproteobacteria bacterium]MBM3641827.1 cell division topological specificity factor MinE [Alphaproteobacteria bacterium]
MNIFGLFGRRGATAPVARERLQILLAHERKSARDSNLIGVLHKEVLAAISKHIAVDPDKVMVKMHRKEDVSLLEIDIEIESDAAHEDDAIFEEDVSGKAA